MQFFAMKKSKSSNEKGKKREIKADLKSSYIIAISALKGVIVMPSNIIRRN